MIRPILNPNGSSVADLTDPRLRAVDLLQDALEELAKVKPHGRDYPMQFDQFERDRAIYTERVALLRKVRSVIYDEAVHIKRLQP